MTKAKEDYLDVYILKIIWFLTFVASTGVFIDLIKDGGAREQGVDNNIQYSGVLDLFPKFWFFTVLVYIAFRFAQRAYRSEMPDVPWLAFFLFALSSAIWSEYYGTAIFVSSQLVLCFFLIAITNNRYGVYFLLYCLNDFCIFILISSLVVSIFVPSYGVSLNSDSLGAWQGVFFHKNLLGGFCALSFLVSCSLYKISSRRQYLLLGALSVFLVAMSRSGTSIIAVTLAGAFFAIGNFKVISNRLMGMSAIYMVILLLLTWQIMSMSIDSSGAIDLPFLDKDTSFSGRNLIWAFVLIKILESPVYGYGLGQLAASNNQDGSEFLENVGILVSSAHNGYLDLAYALGLVGVALFLLLVVRYIKSINRFIPNLAFCYLVFFMTLNVLESRLVGFNINFIFFMYLYWASVKAK